MSWIGRFANLFRRDRIADEIAEELASHMEEALERGRPAGPVRKAIGNSLAHRERSRDYRLLPWLDSLASDVVFGWRQLRKRPVVSGAAILSLALAIGSTTAAFRLIDAVMLRTLPVAHPEGLFYLAGNYFDRDGRPSTRDDFDYPTFRQYRKAVADRADLMLVGNAGWKGAVFEPGAEPERVWRQHMSGNVFSAFGLQPALGRLLQPYDDVTPGSSPVAVLSYDFWSRRFGRAADVLGKSFRMEADRYQIIGVAPKGFIGTEPGTVTDVYLPSMMNREAINSPGWSWFRLWARPKTGFSVEQVLQPLQAAFVHEHEEGLKRFESDTPRRVIDAYLSERLSLLPAASGASNLRQEYRRPLLVMAAFVVLVLLIACTNVGNLMTAQAAARVREMALRVSIGAGQRRLIQQVLVESALLAGIASVLGAIFASWSTPLVVSMLRVPEDPVRLVLDSGWRGTAFTVMLAFLVALLFGLAPALRASGVKPISALRGGEDPRSRRRSMNVLLAAQLAFCVVVQFVAGLFVSSFERLSNRPLGFSGERVIVMDPEAGKEMPAGAWMQVGDRLREVPGVQSVAMSGWPLLSRNRWSAEVRVPGHDVETQKSYMLDVSPGFFETMRIGQLDGREFRPGDVQARLSRSGEPVPGVGIVNESFARMYFDGQSPVGKSVWLRKGKDVSVPMEIVGYVRDAAYYDVRDPMHATIFVPMEGSRQTTILVRTALDPQTMMPVMRQAMAKARSDIRVPTVQSQMAFFRWQTLRERLLGTLSVFFAIVALALAAIGLYGVLNYSVTWQRREIGIRMALGARPVQVVRRVAAGLGVIVTCGLAVGLVGGLACGRFVQSLLFGVKAGEAGTLAAPLLTLLGAAVVAGLPPAIRAAKIDPAETLRSE